MQVRYLLKKCYWILNNNQQYKKGLLVTIKQLVPYLTVSNAERAIDFYRDALGFVVVKIGRNSHGDINHVEMNAQGVAIMFAPEGACSDPSLAPVTTKTECAIGLYLYCEDVDVLFQQSLEQGAKSRSEPRERYWGDKMGEIEDLDGYQWYLLSSPAT